MVIPNSVTVIESYAFRDCIGLTNMTIPNSVEKIGDDVFRDCSGLTNVTIGKSVKEIGMSPFENCTALSTLYLLNPTPPMLGYDLGNNLSENLTIFVPQSALAAYKQNLRWKNFQNLQGFDPK